MINIRGGTEPVLALMEEADPQTLTYERIEELIELYIARLENLNFETTKKTAYLKSLNEEKARRDNPPTETG